MLYALEQSPSEQRIIRECLREGLPFPKAIQNAPTLQLGLEMYYAAYMDLTTDRTINMQIPWTAVKQWAIHYELDDIQFEELLHIVRALDVVWNKWNKRKSKDGGS